MAVNTAARTQAEAHRADYLRRVAAIENDKRLSKTTREAALARLYMTARSNATTLLAAHRVEVGTQRKMLQDPIFLPPEGVDAGAYHQALRSVGDLKPEQLATLLARAERTGDLATAHACFVAAVERNTGASNAVIKQYAAAHPDGGQRLDALRAFADQLADRNDMLFGPLRPPMRPTGLRGLNDLQLQRLAESDPQPEPEPSSLTDSRLPILPASMVQAG
jgi:hypothetical protein